MTGTLAWLAHHVSIGTVPALITIGALLGSWGFVALQVWG